MEKTEPTERTQVTSFRSFRSWHYFRELPGAVLDFVYPERCAWCQEWLEGDRRGSFCLPCWMKISGFRPPWCMVCGIPFEGVRLGDRCGRCLIIERPAIDVCRYGGAYGDVLRKAIHLFKFERRWRTTRALLRWFDDRLSDNGLGDDFMDIEAVVPIPLHLIRLKERGTNHAWVVARAAARRLKKPVWEVLKRERQTLPQSELTRAERAVNVRRAFVVRSPYRVTGKSLLLVDDIVTTGATMESAARALRRAGARSVKVLALARTL